jgi:glycosyltransferase involved in cell wall biosynthesis
VTEYFAAPDTLSAVVGSARRQHLRVVMLLERSESSRYFETAVPLLHSSGVDVSLVSLRPPGTLHDALTSRGIPALSLNSRTARSYPWAAVRLRSMLAACRPDVLHAHEPIASTLAGLATLGNRTAPVAIFHRHHTYLPGRQAAFSWAASRLCPWTMAVSQAVADAAMTIDRVSPRRVCVAQNGIPPLRHVSDGEVKEIRVRLGIAKDSHVVVIVARLRVDKGVQTVIRAMPTIRSQSARQVHLVIVGDGPMYDNLQALALTYGSRGITFVGHQDDVASWYALADVVAVPSLTESFGLSALEAMAAARPVVASRVGGLREVVADRVSGVLVPPGDPNALAAAISRLLVSPDRAHSLAVAAALHAGRLTTAVMVASWMACYEGAMNAVSRSSG